MQPVGYIALYVHLSKFVSFLILLSWTEVVFTNVTYIGKYNLSQIWDKVLFNTPGLKLVSSQQPSAKR